MRARDSRTIGFLTVAALALSMGGSRALGDEVSFEKALPSLTWVLSPTGGDNVSSGSGVLIDVGQGLVLTAYHVVEDRPKVLIFFPYHHADGTLETDPKFYTGHLEELAIVGQVIASEPGKDLALIRLPKVPAAARATPLAARSPRTGQDVFAIGNSGSSNGVLWRYLDGRVRQVFRRKMAYASKQQVDARVVETTVPTNSGDSGGPVLNAGGELVAITASSYAKEVAVNYGIDVEEIRAMVGPTLARVERPESTAPATTADFLPPPPPDLEQAGREYRPGGRPGRRPGSSTSTSTTTWSAPAARGWSPTSAWRSPGPLLRGLPEDPRCGQSPAPGPHPRRAGQGPRSRNVQDHQDGRRGRGFRGGGVVHPL
jgi:S1-C subfamily serine protease